MKHIELFKNGFDSTIDEKIKPENYPYVGNDGVSGEIVYTLVPEENQSGYQMIDLGLSVKWADRNVGAETPQDNGLYFSWGNVDGHRADENGNTIDGYSFDNVTYYTTTLGSQYTDSELDIEHDAAAVNMGGNWRMPTFEEISELAKNTVHYYIGKDGSIVAGPFNYEASKDDKGLDGHKLRSICFVKKDTIFDYNVRDNFIEFPFAGYFSNFAGTSGSSLLNEGANNHIWSSSTSKNNSANFAYNLNNTCDGYMWCDCASERYCGFSVRGVYGVRKPEIPIDPENPIGHEIPEDNQIERV